MYEYFLSTSNLYEPAKKRVLEKLDVFCDSEGKIIKGAAVSELEQKLKQYHNSEYCIAYSTGFWALVAAAINKAKPNKREVILPSLTYRRLADVVYWTGNIPVFVDIELENLSISASAVRDNISKNTGLIIAVHPIVNCCDVEELIKISEENDVPIIFDGVESVHETFAGKRIGSFGVGEIFSLHASKLLNGLEGGYICTNDKDFANKLISFREGGDSFNREEVNLNCKLNDIHAIFALSSLEEIEKNVAHNREIYMQYEKNLSNNRQVRLLKFDESQQTSYKNIVIELLTDSKNKRDELVHKLNKQKILARAHYYPPLHTKEYDYHIKTTNVENTNFASTRFMNLPCGHRVTCSDVDFVCSVLKECI